MNTNRKNSVVLLVFLAASGVLSCSSGTVGGEAAVKEEQVKVEGWFRPQDADGRELGLMVSFRLPMPPGLKWNTWPELMEDIHRDAPASQMWLGQPVYLSIEGKRFSNMRKQFCSGLLDALFVTTDKAPAAKPVPVHRYYNAVFWLPAGTDIVDKQLSIWHVQTWGKESDVAKLEPDLRAKIGRAEWEAGKRILRAKVEGTEQVEVEGRTVPFARIRVNFLEEWTSLFVIQEVRGFRIGNSACAGELHYMLDHAKGRMEHGVIEAAMKERPDVGAGVFLRVEGIEGWMKCDRYEAKK